MELMSAVTRERSRPELLSPAGDWDCLRAAVAGGADAVYFGLTHFNARHRAANFTLDELPQVLTFLHGHNVRGYVTLNTLLFSDELPEVVRCVQAIAAAGADAVIVQDLGLARLIHRLAPQLPVHASTQMTLTEPAGIDFVARLGVERVILARELSMEEVRRITAHGSVPVEVFVHGALCVAYSGQCLTSEALGGRSANRGQCAQACRLPYEMYVDGRHHPLGDRAYLLSPQDLAAYDLIAPLVEAGVACFKIEGRLKSAAYVATATRTYRQALDAALAGQAFTLSVQGRLDLEQSFSRGFSPGFLAGVNHQQLVQGRFPKSRGVQVGSVVGKTRRGVLVALARSDLAVDLLIKPGDGVVFDEGRPEEQERGGRVFEVLPHQGKPQTDRAPCVELTFGRSDRDVSRVAVGTRVWKTDDPAFRKRALATVAQSGVVRRIAVDACLQGQAGSALTLLLQTADGHSAQARWAGPLELAHKRPFTEAAARDLLGRLGETPFALRRLTFDLPEGLLVPASVVNDLRRQAVSQLLAQRQAGVSHPLAEPKALELLRAELRHAYPAPPPLPSPRMYVLVRNREQLEAVLAWQPPAPLARPALVWCDFEDVRRYRAAVELAHAAGMPIGLASLRIIKPGEEGFLHPIGRLGADALLVRNLAALAVYRQLTPQPQLVGDFALNVANELTAGLLAQQGLTRLVPSYDLSWEQLREMTGRIDPGLFEVVVHHRMPMFHTEWCAFAAYLSNGTNHTNCGRPCDRHTIELRDRAGVALPVHPDAGCRNTIYNAVAQSAAEYLPRMLELGLRHFRIELLRETAAQVGPLLEQYGRVLAGLADGRDVWRHLRALNQLGVTRGTLNLL
jgi:putative protease